jgi:hypothetical protein
MVGQPEAFAMLRRSSRAGGNHGMLRNRKSLGLVILVLIGLAYIVWVISGSQTFGSCFHDREQASAYLALYESDDAVLKSILRVRLNSECILSVLINHGGAITAISSAITAISIFFIAIYTHTVSDTVRALRDTANKQQEDIVEYLRMGGEIASAAKKSADAAEKTLIFASRPLIEIQNLSLEDAKNGESPYICFQFRNIGKGTGIVSKVIVASSTNHTLKSPITLASTGRQHFVVEAGGTIYIGPIRFPILYDTQVAKIRMGNIRLDVIIQVMFSDIFGTHYDQKFPFVFDDTQRKFILDIRLVETK